MSEPRSRRVAFLIDCLYGEASGGTERQFLQIYSQCRSIGVDPYVIFLRDAKIHASLPWRRPPMVLGVNSLGHPRALIALYRLWRFLHEEQIEVVHTWFDDAAILGALLKRVVPWVFLITSQRNIGYAQRWPRSVLTGMALRSADRIVVNAGIIRNYVVASHGVSADRVAVIPNLYEPRDCMSAEAEALMLDLRSRHEILVVTVANLRPVKGIDDLLKAAALIQGDTRIGYVIIGDGDSDSMKRYTALVRELDLSDRVHLLGYRTDIGCFLRHADIGVLPSRSEGLSNSLIEYMFAALPIVATNVGGNREALDDGASGRLVPPANPGALAQAILALARDMSSARFLGEQAAKSARRRYDRGLILDGYRTLYRGGAANWGSPSGRGRRQGSGVHGGEL